ncbi:LysR family transcriptional regulator [Aliiroseovarius crassostreae]|uniref:LysR family transcriptional regulator n=1 Tax=Aliiroseovarius crassostreae TaxID=154981 RepID=UPI0021AE7B6C|nr:LysR family transcriptional regulator [Aliiroseovarius crassostreae]UWQ04803.1 LysR family transcriptional regulator [Aliiroseovarius crassostreae]
MSVSQLSNLPLDWVRAFEAAARTGSFTGAARETGLTQAAISQRIGQLEARLGVRLFIRQARGVVLSVDGEAWLPYVSHGLTTLDQSAEELFGMRRKTITLSASASMLAHWIAPRLAEIQMPGEAQISCQTMVLSAASQRETPMVRVRYGDGSGAFDYKAKLFADALSPVCAPRLIRGGRRWQDLPRLAVTGPRAGWQAWATLTGDPTTPVPLLRFDTFTAAVAAARAGAGVLMASLPLVQAELGNERLLRLSDHVLRPAESHWMTASKQTVSKKQWAALTAALCI